MADSTTKQLLSFGIPISMEQCVLNIGLTDAQIDFINTHGENKANAAIATRLAASVLDAKGYHEAADNVRNAVNLIN